MRLVVGYLATPSGEDGLTLGVRLARTLGAEIDLCTVVPDQDLVQQAQRWLRKAAATVLEAIPVSTQVSVNESFAEGLIAEATRLDAEAIVIGAAGDGLVGRYSIGSVTRDLLYSAPVPVALAPRGTRDSAVGRVREVTCAIGQRPGANELLRTAVRASSASGTPLRLVSLVALDPIWGELHGDSEAVRGKALGHARLTLQVARDALPEGFPVSAMVTDGPTVEAAVNKLDWHDGDLIMVGSSRLGTPKRLFMGSTAAKMLRVLEVPMVVVPKGEGAEAD